MTTGATVDQAQWAAYRQVIRDIPQTYKDKTPDDVVWPTQPSLQDLILKFFKKLVIILQKLASVK